MTDPDRYAGGCYGWGQHDVPTLAGFLDEDLSTGWTQVSAWWQSHDLTAAHLDVLRQARAQIVEIWPPTVSPASAAFVDQLDALIASMDNMVTAAASNATALNGILTVLESARHKVDGLHAQWEAAPPSWVAKASKWATPLGPLVQEDDERAKLNAQAAQVMTDTDNSVYAYMPHLIVVPPPTTTIRDQYDPTTPSSSGGASPGGGRSTRPPVIPPVRPPAVVDSGRTGEGPELAGAPSGESGVSTASGASGQSAQSGTGLSAPGSLPIPTSSWVNSPAGRVLRSGAVLGGPTNLTDPQSSVSNQPNPSNTGRSVERSPEPGPGFFGSGVGASASRRRSRRTMPPDTEWAVPDGVPPVLEPRPERPHDPGPGVIGIDR